MTSTVAAIRYDSLPPAPDRIQKLIHAAWMAILLGLFMQIIVSSSGALAGGPLATYVEQFRDGAQKVSWSTLVCLGVAAGTAASKARVRAAGIAGLIAAPAAFVTAKMVQKSTATALGVAPAPDQTTAIFIAIISLKALQYGLLGGAVAWIAGKRWGGLRAHLGIGFLVGVIFGGAIIAITYFSAAVPPPAPKVVAQAVNEVIFPMGCATVLFAAGAIGRRAAHDVSRDPR